jgi:FkbM family methyltransferase|tara:strand:+ start:171 stop:968 length:798 start_codon:yes stop_codon:yes gene_type:complete
MHLALNDDETNIEESTIKIFKKRIKVNQKQFIDFFCPNKITATRVNSIFSKEPETIEWIKSFENNSIFWDIGANIGLYSLYAAIINNSKVFAFEPAASNYFCLCKNIELNNLDNQVFPLSLSFSDKTKLAPLNMISTEYGSSQNEFDYEKNDQGETADFIFKQASMGFTVDDFIKIYNPPLPNHLKIDVDGIENLIVKGASTLLSHKNLNDISIEINEKNQNAYQSITKILESFNFSLTHKKHSPIFDLIPDYSIYNFIFSRTTT